MHTYGARLGGPIIKDKLFFFANVELLREEEPFPFIAQEYEGEASAATLNGLADFVRREYGYEPGGYLNNTGTRNSDKVIAKIDWNINRNHKLSLRHKLRVRRNHATQPPQPAATCSSSTPATSFRPPPTPRPWR